MKIRKMVIIFLFFQGILIQAQEDWKLVKENKGIQVFTKSAENHNFKTFKAHIILDASIHSFVSVINDIENFKDWGYKIIDASILKRKGDTLQIYYSNAKAPFPYKNRDGIYLNRFRWMSEAQILYVDIEILDTYLPLNDKMIRVKGTGIWKVTVLPLGKLEIIFEMQLDPGGNIPAWMANMFVDESPYHTLLKLKEVIQKDKYQNQKFDFLN